MSYTITGGGTISNTNVKGSSSQYDVGPSGDSGVTKSGIVHNSGKYIYATGVTLTNTADPSTGVTTFTKTIAGQQGASVTHSDSTKLINGGYNYGDGTTGGNDTHTYNPNGSYTATYTVANDLQSLSISTTSNVAFVSPPTISITSSQSGRTFTITKTATDATSYIWYVNDTQYSTTSGNLTYTFSGYNPDSATVYCKATGEGGSTNSNTLTLSVSGVSPTITVNTPTYSGRVISLTSTATNTTSYQWQYSTDNTNWTNGGTSSTYSYTVPDNYSGYMYFKCTATNSYTSITSSTVTSKQWYAVPTVSISGSLNKRTYTITPTYTNTTSMVWKIDGTQFSTTLGTVSYTFDKKAEGTFSFTCTATGNGGSTTSNTLSVTIEKADYDMMEDSAKLRRFKLGESRMLKGFGTGE